MRKKYLKNIYLSIILILSVYSLSLSFDSENEMNKIQGIVMEIDLKKNLIIVNERPIFLDQNTLIQDSRGISIFLDSIKKGSLVYIEWANNTEKNRPSAKRIYLLPEYYR